MTDARNYALAAFANAAEPWLHVLRALQGELEREPELLAQLGDRAVAFSTRQGRLR